MTEVYKDYWIDFQTRLVPLYIINNLYGVWIYNTEAEVFARILNQNKIKLSRFEKVSWLELLVTAGITINQAEQIKIQSQKTEWFSKIEVLSGLV
jgi:hypothetical protein